MISDDNASACPQSSESDGARVADRPLRVCHFGTYDDYTPRNNIIPLGLRESGVTVLPCQADLWGNTENRIGLASGQWLSLGFLLRWIRAVVALARQYRRLEEHEAVIVGYPGVLDVYLGWLLTRCTKRVLAYDALMSLYLITCERGIAERHPISARLLFWAERTACHLADIILLDTEAYRDYFCQTFDLPKEKFLLLPLGADTRVFFPQPTRTAADGPFRIVHYSKFIPGTGVDVIVRAAYLLRDDTDIRFELIGDGQTYQEVKDLATHLGLKNVEFVGWVEKPELPDRVASADVCLGVFSQGLQASMTVVNKLYECLAMGRPLITGDSPAVRSTLHHLEHAYLCDRESPEALAEAIRMLKNDPDLCEQLARQGHKHFLESFTPQSIGATLRDALESRPV